MTERVALVMMMMNFKVFRNHFSCFQSAPWLGSQREREREAKWIVPLIWCQRTSLSSQSRLSDADRVIPANFLSACHIHQCVRSCVTRLRFFQSINFFFSSCSDFRELAVWLIEVSMNRNLRSEELCGGSSMRSHGEWKRCQSRTTSTSASEVKNEARFLKMKMWGKCVTLQHFL